MFPVNPVDKVRENLRNKPVEAIGEEKEKKNLFQEFDHQDEFEKQLEDKIKKLMTDKKFLKSLNLSDINLIKNKKLLDATKNAAMNFLKKELLNITKSIFFASLNNDEEEIDENNLTPSEILAKLILKHAKIYNTTSKKNVKNKVERPNPNKDKNAGFLAHYGREILNKRIPKEKIELKK